MLFTFVSSVFIVYLFSIGLIKLGYQIFFKCNTYCYLHWIGAGRIQYSLIVKKQRFLYCIITGNKNSVYFNMKECKESPRSTKQIISQKEQELHPRKFMSCLLWDWKTSIHYEVLANNETVNVDLYVQQVHRCNIAI